ncbi:MAG: hypothetical protein AB8B88_13480 [Devosiaceae bacterium]
MNEVATEYEQMSKCRNAGALWTLTQRFWLFGTATYAQGDMVTLEQAERNARRFFNALDLAVLGKRELHEGMRLQRHVFAEQGRLRANTHIHFFIKGRAWHHYSVIKRHAQPLWLKLTAGARDLVLLDNMGLNRQRAGYGWKELRCYAALTPLYTCFVA